MSKEVARLRYMITLMGFFAMYCGLIYNEFFAVAIPIPGSCYEIKTDAQGDKQWSFTKRREDGSADFGNCVYPFGLDFAWGASGNEVSFFNSFKMKLAVILGIFHMGFAIMLKGANAIYFKSAVDFICEFIPQFVFFIGLFGYMVLLIVWKWLTDWTPVLEANHKNPGSMGIVPQIIGTFSQIYVNPAPTNENGNLPIIGYNNNYEELKQNPSKIQYYIQLIL